MMPFYVFFFFLGSHVYVDLPYQIQLLISFFIFPFFFLVVAFDDGMLVRVCLVVLKRIGQCM